MQVKFYIQLPALFISLFLSATVLQAQVVETEPDNTPAQANTFAINGNASGALNVAGDVDWYKITTTADGQINITFDNTGNQDIKSVALYDNDGITSINSGGVGNGIGGINTDGLAAGTYYIKIYGNSGSETGAYILSANLAVPPLANDKEPNNNFSEADTLSLNDSITGHIGYYYNNKRDSTDWYVVTTNADGLLNITFDNTGHQDLKVVSLYDSSGTLSLTAVSVGNGIGGLQKDGLSAGTYYIKINGTSGSEFGAYQLSDTLITPVQAVDIEPNNIFSQADILGLNDSVTGHIGYYHNGAIDTTDWYKVTTTLDGLLKLSFDNTGHQDLKIVSLYDSNGVTLINTVAIGNGAGGLNMDGLAAGTYYIKINGASGNEFGGYTLSDTLITPKPTNDNEPNNNFSQATSLSLNDSTTGHVGYYYNNRRDTTDWYKINITHNGSLTISLDNSGNPNLLSVILYDASGSGLVTSFNVGNGTGNIHTDTLVAGIYYIQVIPADANQFGAYILVDSFINSLPVTLINFDGKLNNGEAILSWRTASEINNKGFTVQKSIDAGAFSDIGFVAGKGNSSVVNSYSFFDVKVVSGSNYYRLKQTDIDNRLTFSPIIKIDYSKFDWVISGNPVSANSSLQLQLDKKSIVTIQIVSADGKIIQSIDKGNLLAGTYSIPLNFSKTGSGMYFIKLTAIDQSGTKRGSKQIFVP
ncbi:MAG: T9SS type A sorting domain-containing protein [Ferruginibacter sp.]